MNGISDASASTATDKLQPGSWQIPRRWSVRLDHRATGSAPARRACWVVSAHWLYFGRLLDPDHWLNHLCWLLSCSWGVKSFCCWKNDCLWSHPSIWAVSYYCRFLPLALTSGSCFITKHSALPSPFIPVWSGTELVREFLPAHIVLTLERDTIIRREGKMTFGIRTNASRPNSMLHLIRNQLAVATMTGVPLFIRKPELTN